MSSPEPARSFAAPVVMDSSAATATFGISPTPVVDALREMLPGTH